MRERLGIDEARESVWRYGLIGASLPQPDLEALQAPDVNLLSDRAPAVRPGLKRPETAVGEKTTVSLVGPGHQKEEKERA